MKKTWIGDCKEVEKVFECGDLVIDNQDEVYIVTDEKTLVCVYSNGFAQVGAQFDIINMENYSNKIFHGTVTMKN